MKDISIFLCMIFLHIIDDFKLQGILADFKQISWWKKNAPDKLYKNDWVISLVIHCVSWAFLIMFPIMIWYNWEVPIWFPIVFVANTAIHFIVDHLKANCHKINLVQDQLSHFVQIIFTFTIFIFLR